MNAFFTEKSANIIKVRWIVYSIELTLFIELTNTDDSLLDAGSYINLIKPSYARSIIKIPCSQLECTEFLLWILKFG